MKIQLTNISDIKPYELNAKQHPPEQIQRIAHSIQEFGWQQPLVIDKNGVLIIGHGRLLAAMELGIEEVPCVLAEDLSADQVRALRLADNKVAESDWDMERLTKSLQEISDIDMSDFGFDLDGLEDDLDYYDEPGDDGVWEGK